MAGSNRCHLRISEGPYKKNKCSEILQMSTFSESTFVSHNGFFSSVLWAYGNHHNLIIRPDDIWAAIMIQFSFYVNKNAEEFRGKFVNFEEKKKLVVWAPGTLSDISYDYLVKVMSAEIQKNLVDREGRDWILPNFSTTTDTDVVSMGVVFMATMKKYFEYGFRGTCGIPEITLEGTVEDWENIYSRIEKLKEYNLDEWYNMLKPVLEQFVNARKGNVAVDFWEKMVTQTPAGCAGSYTSGWITVFCAFDAEGNWKGLNVEGKDWLEIHIADIPTGIVEVDVEINDNGATHNSLMIAGHLATDIKEDGFALQPALGWFIASCLKPDNVTSDSHPIDSKIESRSLREIIIPYHKKSKKS